jgi:hypothetical protein
MSAIPTLTNGRPNITVLSVLSQSTEVLEHFDNKLRRPLAVAKLNIAILTRMASKNCAVCWWVGLDITSGHAQSASQMRARSLLYCYWIAVRNE